MIRRYLPLLCALALSAVSLSAQVKKGFKFLAKSDYPNALKAFQKDLGKSEFDIAARYGVLKTVAGLGDSSRWMPEIIAYEKLREDFKALDPKTQSRYAKDFNLNKSTLEQAYNALFSKVLVFVERNKTTGSIQHEFLNSVTVIPKQFGGRYNKLFIAPPPPPPPPPPVSSTPAHSPRKHDFDPNKQRGKAIIVDRTPPAGSKLEFVKGVNTNGSEFVPVIAADGKLMFFVGSGRADNFAREDVYFSLRNADGSWSEPQIDTFFSGSNNEAVVSMSADGNNLVLFIEGIPHLSTRTATGWSEPVSIILPRRFVWIGMASITRNGEALIFEAREGWGDDIDIYVSLRETSGGWDVPFDIGHVINTPQLERTPFLHSDFKTLYFSSNGHGGEGSFDVFKTTRLDDSWKNWSAPENLGKGVNTPKDEYGFCIPPSGKVAYLATRVDGYTDQDILRIPLDSTAQPELQVVITGVLKDSKGKGLQGEITVEDAEKHQVLQKVPTQPNGSYVFSVPKTAKILYYATGDSLISTKKTFVDASKYKSEVAEEKIELVSVKEAEAEGKPIELRDLLFDFAKSELRPDAQEELKRIYQSIQNRGWQIEIGGHTDNIGSDQSNLLLSRQRAQAVRDFLVTQGYPAAKITFKGYGASVPLSSNDSEEGRARNRRVEMKVRK